MGWIMQLRCGGSAVYVLTSNTLQGHPPSRHSGSCGSYQAKCSHQAKLCDSSGIWSCPRGRPCHECDTRGSGASALFAHFCDCNFSLLASSACQSPTSGATYTPRILTAGTVPRCLSFRWSFSRFIQLEACSSSRCFITSASASSPLTVRFSES